MNRKTIVKPALLLGNSGDANNNAVLCRAALRDCIRRYATENLRRRGGRRLLVVMNGTGCGVNRHIVDTLYHACCLAVRRTGSRSPVAVDGAPPVLSTHSLIGSSCGHREGRREDSSRCYFISCVVVSRVLFKKNKGKLRRSQPETQRCETPCLRIDPRRFI